MLGHLSLILFVIPPALKLGPKNVVLTAFQEKNPISKQLIRSIIAQANCRSLNGGMKTSDVPSEHPCW